MADAINYEQLDLFYLGREVDPHTGEATRRPLLIKNKQLTSHAAIIGMTGSGKTGLGIALLEEAAMDRLPAIVIDPKGDMANLLLTFPDLAAADFRPWIDPAAAEQKGLSVDELAGRTADQWRQGLADWDQDGERIRRMRASAEFAVYTPGSAAVRPVSILDSLEAPSAEVLADTETLADMIGSTVASLLGLLGIDADPLKSREHVLLSTILHDAWQQGQSLSLETLITRVAQPPFKQVGVFPVDAFYPPAKRMELALQLNTLIASPAFGGWVQGEPLAIEELLYTPAGKPRIAIFTIAHLSDSERMFFVTLLLGRLLGWMRRQEGAAACAACSTWTRSSAFSRPAPTRRPRNPCCCCSSRPAPSASAWSSPPRTRWTWTTRAWPTSAPGSWAGCRPARTRTGSSPESPAAQAVRRAGAAADDRRAARAEFPARARPTATSRPCSPPAGCSPT